MLRDINGEFIAEQVWHGGQDIEPGAKLLPASDKGGWWQLIDHETFLNPPLNEQDPNERLELDHQLRTAYANIVYEAFVGSGNNTLCKLATKHGLQNLGNEVSIIFVSENRDYAESYGIVLEIDLDADGLLAAISDQNINRGFGNWLLVLNAGSSFPIRLDRSYSPGA